MKALDSPIAKLALWAGEAGSLTGARTTIKSEGTKPKVLPNEDCLSTESFSPSRKRPRSLTRRESRSFTVRQPLTFSIRKCRNKAAKPFRISIPNEKQSWKFGMCRIRNRRGPFGGCFVHPARARGSPLGSLTQRRTFSKIKKYRNKAAKPFRMSIANEKQS
jgi:hypothetical protein